MIHVMSWFCLRMHAAYRCRHTGVCCRADWEIPAETHVLHAVDTTALRRSTGGRALMVELDRGIDVQVPRGADRTCLFFEPRERGSCAIHREAGEAALPSACRLFPREIVIGARRTLVSLSHYCPTAAALLTTPGALDIVEARPPLAVGGSLEGLDARDALPPLVRPGLLSDPDGYDAWESACLEVLARPDLAAWEALDAIETLTERVLRWSPGQESLRAAVRAAAADLRPTSDSPQTPRRRLASDFAPLVAQYVPEETFPVSQYEERWQPLVEGSADVELVMKNYLAARVFANWVAYQGQGLRTVVEWLRTCHAVIRNEMAVRCMTSGRAACVADALAAAGRADLLMVHTIDSQAFVRLFS